MLNRANALAGQLCAWRREFHMHPELGFQETHTAARVAGILANLGYRVRTGVGKTGVVAERGQGPPIVAVRADMDALPLQEENAVPYASQVPGVMHACGHDAHTAIALGVATLLARVEFPGTLRLLFQPSEEASDARGRGGALHMIGDGAMAGVSRVLALHVDNSLAVGDVGLEAGPVSAGVDSFYVTIIGKGGHGAAPHDVVDPIYIAAHVLLALHGIVSRRVHPWDPAVISVGSIHAGQADNVIPERVEMSGTIRFITAEVRAEIHAEIKSALRVARALGGRYRLRIVRGGLPVVNDAGVIAVLRDVAGDLLGAGHVQEVKRRMGAEDFSDMTALAPGAMFRLGSRTRGEVRLAHSPCFDLDEAALPIGAAILAEAALRLLQA